MSCIFHLHEESAQYFLEDNLDRRLPQLAPNRMKLALSEYSRAQSALMDMMYSAGKDALDNADGQWDEKDKDFLSNAPLFPDLSCKE